MNVAATLSRLDCALIYSRFHDIDGGLTKRARHCALDYTDLVETNTCAATCEQETNGIGQYLEDDDPPRVGNFDTCVFSLDGVGEDFGNFLVA